MDWTTQRVALTTPQGHTVVQHLSNGGGLHRVECRHLYYNGYGLAIFVTNPLGKEASIRLFLTLPASVSRR